MFLGFILSSDYVTQHPMELLDEITTSPTRRSIDSTTPRGGVNPRV